mmetsp:Transcript_21083/g.23598  ORF Transcript_21083/g.23598 Transcript_21083/m.23598 type:complete len:85 (+) Transcript_21083:101-355(+)
MARLALTTVYTRILYIQSEGHLTSHHITSPLFEGIMTGGSGSWNSHMVSQGRRRVVSIHQKKKKEEVDLVQSSIDHRSSKRCSQ